MRRRLFQMLLGIAIIVSSVGTASANSMHVSDDGTGQVLLFPYYTARNGNVSLISLVNTTVQGKAVRVNVREARGGFVVAQFNLYMSAKDVWTASIVSDADGAQLVSNDLSCIAPAIGTGLPLSAEAYRLDGSSFTSRDRTREGYIEVIEMASIPNATRTGVAITHVAGVPACVVRFPEQASLSSITYELPAADLAAPIGGLMGSLSFVNVTKGMLASAAPTAIEGFWLTGPDAPSLRVVPANSATVDLTSGKNTSITLSSFSLRAFDPFARPDGNKEQYTARFATSIDALSALLTASTIYAEYAYTKDGVISTLISLTMPTKPYYIRGNALGPFASLWSSALAKSCDRVSTTSVDRNEFVASPPDDFSAPPGAPRSEICWVANPIVPTEGHGILPTTDQTYFGSSLAVGLGGIQDAGSTVSKPGKEGGTAEIFWTHLLARLQPPEATVYRRNTSGALAWEPVKIALQGLPIIGFTLSQAAYKTGSPQQNFADAIPLRSQMILSVVP